MPLPWVRLDTSMPTHDKVLDLLGRYPKDGRSTAFVYCCSLSYCGQHGTDGLVSFAALPFVHATKKDAERLVEVGLWVPVPLGWQIPNWLERQQSQARAAAITAGKRRGALKANCVRWHGPDCDCWSRDE